MGKKNTQTKGRNTNTRTPAKTAAPRRVAASTAPAESEEEEEHELEAADEMEDEDEDLEAEDEDEDEDADEAESSNGADNAQASSTGQKKPKIPRGKRQVIFVCMAYVKSLPEDIPSRGLKAGNAANIIARIEAPMPPKGSEEEFDIAKGREHAKSAFQAKYGVPVEDMDGPFYIRKGMGGAAVRKRETLNSSVRRRVSFLPKQGTAIHTVKGIDWHVLTQYVSDPNIVEVFYDRPVDEKAYKAMEKRPPKPSRRFLPITSIRDEKITQDLTGSMPQVSAPAAADATAN